MKRARRRVRRVVRWAALSAAVVLVLLYALSVPFYAGSGVGLRNQWRMEHGRLTWRYGEQRRESPWLGGNSEGLKFGCSWTRLGPGAWAVTIPLWLPLVLSMGVAAACLWPQRRGGEERCGHCGYDLHGLDAEACPECGARWSRRGGLPSAARVVPVGGVPERLPGQEQEEDQR